LDAPLDRAFYWRTNAAISNNLRKPRTPADTNALLQKADNVMRSMLALYGRPVLDLAPRYCLLFVAPS
jgi:hypothetical protein